MQDDEIQEDNTLAIAHKYANGDCSSPLENKVEKQPRDLSILWTALIIGGGIYALVYGSHLAAMWLGL